jgi:hypothetical protein
MLTEEEQKIQDRLNKRQFTLAKLAAEAGIAMANEDQKESAAALRAMAAELRAWAGDCELVAKMIEEE